MCDNTKCDFTDSSFKFKYAVGASVKKRSDLVHELATVEIRQYFNTVESPTLAEVKVTQTGLMDDSIAAKRTIYNFKLDGGKWVQVNKTNDHRCLRGKNTKDFQKENCI